MSSTRKAYLYRLYPTAEQARALQQQLAVAREVYNACLLERREAYRRAGLTLTYYAQASQLKDIRRDCPDLAAVNFSMLQALPRGVPGRAQRAYENFFRCVKAARRSPETSGIGGICVRVVICPCRVIGSAPCSSKGSDGAFRRTPPEKLPALAGRVVTSHTEGQL